MKTYQDIITLIQIQVKFLSYLFLNFMSKKITFQGVVTACTGQILTGGVKKLVSTKFNTWKEAASWIGAIRDNDGEKIDESKTGVVENLPGKKSFKK